MLFTMSFWRATWLALVRTFLAASVPFVPGLISDPASIWALWLLTAGLAVVLAIVTALAGLPSSTNGASWWEVALQRAARQFGQFVAAGLAGAAILTDVQWKPLLLAALASSVSTLVMAALDVMPADLTAAPVGADGVPDISSLPATLSLTTNPNGVSWTPASSTTGAGATFVPTLPTGGDPTA